jgi:hypothetical protein
MGAADAMTKVSLKEGQVYYEPDFMKDAESPPSHVLEIEGIPLGFNDQFDTPVSSLVMKMTDKAPGDGLKLSVDAMTAVSLLNLGDEKDFQDWREEWFMAVKSIPSTRGKNKGKKRDNNALRQSWSRVVEKLEIEGMVEVSRDKDKKAQNAVLVMDVGA